MLVFNMKKIAITFLCLLGPWICRLDAHYTWVDMIESADGRQIVLGHGHAFPTSEQAMDPPGISLEILLNDGTRQKVNLQKGINSLVFPIKNAAGEIDQAVYWTEPVIYTKTTTGVKKGNKTDFPNALSAVKMVRRGRFLAGFTGQMRLPAGPGAELFLKKENNAYLLSFFLEQKPVPGVEIAYYRAGEKEGRTVGKTDTSGMVRLGELKPGKYLFTGKHDKASGKPEYDTEQTSVSLTVTLE